MARTNGLPPLTATVAEWRDYTARQTPESQLQAQVRILARAGGWCYYHTRDSRGSDPGFPDCVLVRAGRLVVAELKMVGKRPSADQDSWLDAWRLVPRAEVYVWTPADLDEIARVLA